MSISLLNRPARHALERALDEAPPVTAGGPAGVGLQVKERLWQRMARECEAMMEHALSTGRVVPAEVIDRLDQAISAPDALAVVAAPDRRDDAAPADTAARTASVTESSRFALLAMAHAGLAIAIAPATPEVVLLMADERERHPVRCQFGPLPLVRQMLGITLLSLVIVILLGVGLAPDVTVAITKNLDLTGYPLLMTYTYLAAAASLGACFANLQRINTAISDGNFDPRIQSTYWTRWVMGVIAGIVLSELVFDFLLSHSEKDTSVVGQGPLVQPILALVGGYSVDFVHGILKSMINKLGNFFGISVDDQQRAGMPEAVAQGRVATATELAQLQQALSENPDMDEIRKRIDGLIQRISVRQG